MSFTLFGNLSRFGDGPSKAPFLEQIHTNFVSLLLHLNDEDEDVKNVSKESYWLKGSHMIMFRWYYLGPIGWKMVT